MKIQKRFFAMAAGLMVLALGAAPVLSAEMELKSKGQSYVLATQDVNTAVYTRCNAFLEVIGDRLGTNTINVQPISTGGAAGALLVEKRQAQIATASNIPVAKLAAGTFDKKFKPLQNVSALLGGTDITWGTIMFTDAFVKKTGFTTLEQVIAAKHPVRIVTKAQGSFGMDGATDLLDCLGVTWKDIKAWGGSSTHIAPGTMADMLKEGAADVSIDIISIGQAAFTELCLTTKMHVVELAPETRAAMNKKGYGSMTMPAGSWSGQDKPIETVVGCESLIIAKDMPDDVAYRIVKAICENKDRLVALVPAMKYFEPAKAWDPLYCGIELHPGAAAYFRDAGLMK